jgi:ligand-binding SRPBCC domain-containing protein
VRTARTAIMPVIQLATLICAPRERVFDLARSIDAHQDSTEGTSERAIAGVAQGLIGLNDEVTWEARHLGLRQRLTVRVTEFNRPQHFQDIMVKGAFKSMRHDHEFLVHLTGAQMNDRFEFQSPLGILGKIVDPLFLRAYLERFLVQRNGILKESAESKEWSRYLVHV